MCCRLFFAPFCHLWFCILKLLHQSAVDRNESDVVGFSCVLEYVYSSTVPLLNSPWGPGRHMSTKTNSFSKIPEVVSRPEFAQCHESCLRSDRGDQ